VSDSSERSFMAQVEQQAEIEETHRRCVKDIVRQALVMFNAQPVSDNVQFMCTTDSDGDIQLYTLPGMLFIGTYLIV